MATSTLPNFTGPGGSDPVRHILGVQAAMQPTIGDCLQAGQVLRAEILERTRSGVDAEGNPFAPYSERYRARKAKKNGQADTVDLFGSEQSKHMLNTIQIRSGSFVGEEQPSADPNSNSVRGDEVRVGFYDDEEIETRARVHNEGGTVRTRYGTGSSKRKPKGAQSFSMPRRHFFDVNQGDIDLMNAAVAERIEMRLALKAR